MNITDIAKLANVSPASVSRYLNNGYLSESKKLQIEKVIKDTGYKPSSQAQTLRTKRTNVVAVIVPKINSDSFGQLLEGVSYELSLAGFDLLLVNTENSMQKEADALQNFQNNRVDGILFIPSSTVNEHKRNLKNMEVPVVVIGQKTDLISCIYHDEYQAAKALTNHMIERGRKSIAYIGISKQGKVFDANRKNGFLDSLSESNLPIIESYLSEGSDTVETGYDNARLLLSRNGNIDSIFCASDSIAMGALHYLREQRIKVPEQISIVGMGDAPMAKVLTPTLTTARYYYKTAGAEGAKILLESIQNPSSPSKQMKLGYEVVIRESI